MAQADIIKMLEQSNYIEVTVLPNARRTYHVTGNSIYVINGFGECIQLHCQGDEITLAKALPRQHFQDEVQRENKHGRYPHGDFDARKQEHTCHMDFGSIPND